MKQPMDHQPPRRTLGDATGRAKQERASEYFDFRTWPDKAEKKVTRQELLFWLSRGWLVEREKRWYRRLWRWLVSPRGSKLPAVASLGDRSHPAEEAS